MKRKQACFPAAIFPEMPPDDIVCENGMRVCCYRMGADSDHRGKQITPDGMFVFLAEAAC